MNQPPPGHSSFKNTADEKQSEPRQHSPARRTLISTFHDRQGASSTAGDIVSSPRASQEATVPQQQQSGVSGGGGSEPIMERSSPSISSSQGDMADNEMEAGASQSSEVPQQPANPPKKKRTRTLTTPHQSAVLHALLAQSRFPTTAMREEVGRAIGLSARKVQIWFQNQRQKARRPRGQSGAPLTRPPQFGPFPNAPPGPPGALAGPSSQTTSPTELFASTFPGEGGPTTSGRVYYDQTSQSYVRPMGISHLSGPGIPGPGSEPRSQYSSPVEAQGTQPSQPRLSPLTSYHPPHSSYSYRSSRPATADQALDMYYTASRSPRPARPLSDDLTGRQRDPPIILPPLVLDPPRSRALPGSSHYGSPSPTSVQHSPTVIDPRRRWQPSEHPESQFAHRPPLNIPPPFTLQPRPQWDDPAFSPFSRPALSRLGSVHSTAHAEPYGLPPAIPSAAGQNSSSPILGRPGIQEGAGEPHAYPRSMHTRRHSEVPHFSIAGSATPGSATPRAGPRSSEDDLK
ncbi:homeobox-domain-containing protein [Wolfiporia cocos MD-104 SS10]|uniref:Homeobox-domain-containing protein n=1 Tax=Wolfiporia cocos (strain MD-104) TaxID=742152 RepID=A0A2H3IY66_WOLCO|nr:homeobox-domain-containing protein [Wolfiporia cocos MD-104 SS10]